MALLVLEYPFAFFSRISPPLLPPARLRIKSPSSPLRVAAGVCAAKKQRPTLPPRPNYSAEGARKHRRSPRRVKTRLIPR